jgi:hypothetical protein
MSEKCDLHYDPEYGGSMFFRNVYGLLPYHTVLRVLLL